MKRLTREKLIPATAIYIGSRGGGGVPGETATFNLTIAVLDNESIFEASIQLESNGPWIRLNDIAPKVAQTASPTYLIPKDQVVFEQMIRLRYSTRNGATLEDSFAIVHDTRKSEAGQIERRGKRLLSFV